MRPEKRESTNRWVEATNLQTLHGACYGGSDSSIVQPFPIHFSFHGENLLITQGKRNISTESAEPTYSSRLCLSYRSFYSASASWSVYQATRTPTGACEAIPVNHRRLFRNEKVLISSENSFSIKIDEWSVINVQRFMGLIGCLSSWVSVICSETLLLNENVMDL